MREKELKEALGKLIKQTKRSQNWIIKEDTEVTELAEDLGNILRLELKISAGKYDAAIIHAEKHFLKEAGHEAKTVSRIEKRMDRFCGRLIDALDHYIELETALGRTEELATLRKHRAETDLYKKDLIQERHRHRYEFNNDYKETLEKEGMIFPGINPQSNLVEIAENSNHPFMIGSQFHPEFLSRPNNPHPLFKGFIEASIKNSK